MDARETVSGIAEAMRQAGGITYAEKLEELSRKTGTDELYIAFCGHFSAGKSTLVNRLCGHRLLPSGPIPTSANVVRIRSGEPGARIWRRKSVGGRMELARETIPLDRLEASCKDGEGIETVEIRYPVPLLGDHTILLDTPGIDSTDDAHQAATESALHLADVVFYVMDYNYVQSEINFSFVKRLKDWGKPLYLLVNQIDKHREQELPFTAYRAGVETAFRNWSIEPDGILFLSLKDELHPHNEWGKLSGLIRLLSEQSGELRAWNVKQSVLHLIRDFMKETREGRELEKELYREAMRQEEGLGTISEEYEALTLQLQALDKRIDETMVLWKKAIASIMDNAHLTPAGTRDLAGDYLASRKPGFKAGFFARASQTEAERQKRLEAFHADFAEKVKAHLYWHVADYIRSQAAELRLGSPDLTEALEAFRAHVTAEWLAGQVHPGAEYNGEYTLTYSRQIASEIRQRCRQEALGLLELMDKLLRNNIQQQRRELEEQSDACVVQMAALQGLTRMEREEAEQEAGLVAMADDIAAPLALRLPDPTLLGQELPGRTAAAAAMGKGGTSPSVVDGNRQTGGLGAMQVDLGRPRGSAASSLALDEPAPDESEGEGTELHDRLLRTAASLKEAARLLEALDGMDSAVRSIRERAEKLEDSRFTIALFGAFSAGKSSFANALLGRRLLPVSPNPTTAAINTILPPTPEHPHGTVKVRMKSADTVRAEMIYSMQALGLKLPAQAEEGWESLLGEIRSLRPEDAAAAGKPHITFLKALEQGWPEALPSFGQDIVVGLDRFQRYVAEETTSCFVASIEVHYETPLSEQGVALVDTPGADSINARHTGVAFNYIKNADAILFVTYYNHAFSQADREFLEQLGRVKDTLEMDKMFFLVNAADLASTPEELEGVVRHVEENLLRYGIRNPRIFPVSSQKAVAAKVEGNAQELEASGIRRFERAFQRFASEELAGVALHGAKLELQRSVRQLESWLEEARADAGDRAAKLHQLDAAVGRAAKLPALQPRPEDRTALRKELEELLYYVKQRTVHRFGEWYRLAFNPSALREDAGDLKRAFRAAWRDLIRMIGYQLSQEVLATTLRTEQYINRQTERRWKETGEMLHHLLPGCELEPFSPGAFATPTVAETLQAAEPDEKWLLSFYRNGRHFFEGEGKEKLRQALEAWLAEPIHDYIAGQLELLFDSYARQSEDAMKEYSSKAASSLHSYCEGLRSVWSLSTDPGKLEGACSHLRKLLQDTY